MMNYIWGGMIIISLIVSVFTGHVEQTAAAAVSGAGDAVTLCTVSYTHLTLPTILLV